MELTYNMVYNNKMQCDYDKYRIQARLLIHKKNTL